MEWVFDHRIKYTTEHPVSLIDAANTLIANDSLIRLLPSVLEKIFPEIVVEKVDIELKDAEKGSLTEDFIVAFLITQVTSIEVYLEDGVEAVSGMQILPEYREWVTAFVILLVLYGGKAIHRRLRGDDKPPHAIQGDYNTVINVTAKNLHVSPDVLARAVADTVDPIPKKTLTSTIGRFIRPAKRNGASTIEGFDDQFIGAEAVEEFPSEAEFLEEDDLPSIALENVRLQILALDRQKHKTGWAATFPDGQVSGRRIRLELFPTVSLLEMSKADMVIADVLVEFKHRPEGAQPSVIHMLNLRKVLS